jgi:hypothetical protein
MKRKDIRKIVVNLEFPKDTSELIETKKNLVLNDTYNMSE